MRELLERRFVSHRNAADCEDDLTQHDAYVARIQLLISYETGSQPSSSGTSPSSPSFSLPTHPSTSTATLVPGHFAHSPRSDTQPTGERTPRPSLEDTTQEFSRLSLSLNDDTIRPGGSMEPSSAYIPDPPANPAFIDNEFRDVDASTMQRTSFDGGASVAPLGTSQIVNAFSPVSSQSSPVKNLQNDQYGPISPASSGKSRASRWRPARPSVGLENELDLDISEEEEEMETLDKTPQLGGSSSRMSSGENQIPSPRRFLDTCDTDRPLPPLPSSAASIRSDRSVEGGVPFIHARQASLGRNANMLVSPSTEHGTISQRRQRNLDAPSTGADQQHFSAIDGLPTSTNTSGVPFPPSRNSSTSQTSGLSSILPFRLRTRSQPGRPGPEEVPPLPTPSIRHQASFGSQRKSSIASMSHGASSSIDTSRLDANSLAPPITSSPLSSTSRHGSIATPSLASPSGSLMSPLPESQPYEIIHRPFHLLRLLRQSMDPNGSGSYLTGRLHISPAIWKPAIWPKTASGLKPLGPPRIAAQEGKVRIMESLIINIAIVSRTGIELLNGPKEYRPGEEGISRSEFLESDEWYCRGVLLGSGCARGRNGLES